MNASAAALATSACQSDDDAFTSFSVPFHLSNYPKPLLPNRSPREDSSSFCASRSNFRIPCAHQVGCNCKRKGVLTFTDAFQLIPAHVPLRPWSLSTVASVPFKLFCSRCTQLIYILNRRLTAYRNLARESPREVSKKRSN